MKIRKVYRPEMVVSKGKEPNPLLTDPFLDAAAERLVSSDGRALVALPVEIEKAERSRYLACSLLKAARGLGEPELPAEIHDQEIVEFGVLWPAAQERAFPDWKALLPRWKRGSPGTVTFALNADLLFKIATAMGVAGVCLTIELGRAEGRPSPIVVQPLSEHDEEIGLLMPVAADGAGEGAIGPDRVCPVCGKLLAPGAGCPLHGTPAEAKRKILEGQADEILANAGDGKLNAKDVKGEAVARKAPRRA